MRRIKITTIILAIILITMVAFAGVYIKTQNRMENKVKDYTLGRELKGGRFVEVKVATGENTKPKAEEMTVENYETVKNSIENRLKNFGAQDYTISLNKEDGTIAVELPEDNNTDTYVYLLTADSKVKIEEKDKETELLSDSMVKEAMYTYTANVNGAYQVILELHLTEEGKTKIEEIQNEYAIFADEVAEIEAAKAEKEKAEKEKTEEGKEKTAEATETTENKENQEETRKIAVLKIAGTEYDIERIEKNKIIVNIGGATTNTVNVNNSMAAAAELATLISSGKYPINYEIGDNRFEQSDITKQHMIIFAIAMLAIMLIVFLVLTIKYKTKGFLASISIIGFISLLSLILRYTNVIITIEGIGAVIISLIINIRINLLMLNDYKNIDYKNLLLKLAPIVIITLVFCFMRWTNLSSFGMVMFWGLMLVAVYNAIVTKTLLKLKESK